MNPAMKRLADRAAASLCRDHGFTRNRAGTRFTGDAPLMRSVWLSPMSFATTGSYCFDVLFDLGIPGLSTFSPRVNTWIVRASGREFRGRSRGTFELTGRESDLEVEDTAYEAIEAGLDQFLFAYKTPHELYAMVELSARTFLEGGMRADDDFRRLRLHPWNVVSRLELASVYGAFLGDDAQADQLAELAVEYATRKGIDFTSERARTNLSFARAQRQAVDTVGAQRTAN